MLMIFLFTEGHAASLQPDFLANLSMLGRRSLHALSRSLQSSRRIGTRGMATGKDVRFGAEVRSGREACPVSSAA